MINENIVILNKDQQKKISEIIIQQGAEILAEVKIKFPEFNEGEIFGLTIGILESLVQTFKEGTDISVVRG